MTRPTNGRVRSWSEPEGIFRVQVLVDDAHHVAVMAGELDIAGRDAALDACASVGRLDVVVDMMGLAFMDCAGYRALVDAGVILERRGGSLVVRHAVGEPLRLLTLLATAVPDPVAWSQPSRGAESDVATGPA